MRYISSKSDWDQADIDRFLQEAIMPIRIAVQDGAYPLICSVWFDYDADSGELVCAVHETSKLARLLRANPHCGFEIAPNHPPYLGIRGKADVIMEAAGAEAALRRLIRRYLGDTNTSLANWLLGRVEGELVVRLSPVWVTAWDYSNRMDPA